PPSPYTPLFRSRPAAAQRVGLTLERRSELEPRAANIDGRTAMERIERAHRRVGVELQPLVAAKVVDAAVERGDQAGQSSAPADRREQLEAQRPDFGRDSPTDPRARPALAGRPGRDPGRVHAKLPGVGEQIEIEGQRSRTAARVEADARTLAEPREIEIEAIGHGVEPRVGLELELAELAAHVIAALQPLD